MPEYMLLLYDRPSNFAHLSPEEMQRIVAEYVGWTREMVASGRRSDSRKLKDEGGRVLRQEGGELAVVDGPYVEAKEVVGGYYVVRAASYDEAVEIARSCPHARYGARIEIREIDDYAKGGG